MSSYDKDDLVARSIAENRLGDLIAEEIPYEAGRMERDLAVAFAQEILATYPSVRFERQLQPRETSDVWFRRLVITEEWEVDPAEGR